MIHTVTVTMISTISRTSHYNLKAESEEEACQLALEQELGEMPEICYRCSGGSQLWSQQICEEPTSIVAECGDHTEEAQL